MKAWLLGLALALFQAAPTTTPSAALPACCIRAGELKPLPPTMGMVSPSSWRAWVTIPTAAAMRAEQTRASGLVPLICVSWAEKSLSALAKVWVLLMATPLASRAFLNSS